MDVFNIEKAVIALRPLLHDLVTDLSLLVNNALNRLNKMEINAKITIDLPPVEGKPALANPPPNEDANQ